MAEIVTRPVAGYGWVPDLPDARDFMKGATKTEPLRLKTRSEDRSKAYFDPGSAKFREGDVFVV